MLPAAPGPGTTGSERAVFEKFANSKAEQNCCCLHSVGIARHRRKSYAEADYFYVGPRGVLCLEVKGGHVSRKDGTWTIGWPGAEYESREGPFKQAQTAHWALRREIENRLPNSITSRIDFGWGVMFPDIQFDETDPEWDLTIVYDCRDEKNDVQHYIDRVAAYARSRRSVSGGTAAKLLSPTDVERIISCLRHDFEVIPGLPSLLAKSASELVRLSIDQYKVLDIALEPSNSRVLCYGPAGTGKTLLAARAAELAGKEGQSVLLICFNRVLGDYLCRSSAAATSGVTVSSLHRFMFRIIEQAGLRDQLDEVLAREPSEVNQYGELYPQYFEEAVISLLTDDEVETYDFLIIDEAQDILFAPIIDSLACVLKGGITEGRWLIFYDPDLQSELYGRLEPKVIEYLKNTGAFSLPLNDNFRNPPAIVADTCALTGAKTPRCQRQLVSDTDYIAYRDAKDQGRKLRALLVDFVRDGVVPSQIAILSGCRLENATVVQHPPDLGKNFSYLQSPLAQVDDDSFIAGTIPSAKGLESEIVILTDLPDGPLNDIWFKTLCYVGMTRTRTKLYVLVREDRLAEFNQVLNPGKSDNHVGKAGGLI